MSTPISIRKLKKASSKNTESSIHFVLPLFMAENKCKKCGMPLIKPEDKCACEESVCRYCCKCDASCTCGCKNKK